MFGAWVNTTDIADCRPLLIEKEFTRGNCLLIASIVLLIETNTGYNVAIAYAARNEYVVYLNNTDFVSLRYTGTRNLNSDAPQAGGRDRARLPQNVFQEVSN